MKLRSAPRPLLSSLAALALAAALGLASQPTTKPDPKAKEQPTAAKEPKHAGDPYPFDTCPISGKKLGAMGDPVVKVYDGREVRYCCNNCPKGFEKDQAASFAKLDEKIVKDQAPLYPLKKSVVTGKDLPEKPIDFVYANRLVRLGAESEKADFNKDPKKYLGELDKAAIAEQGKNYTLKKCPVSNETYGGDMGAPKDVVLAGRLIRLCCNDCKADLEKEPAKYIAAVDAARKGEKTKPDTDKDQDKDKKPHDHK